MSEEGCAEHAYAERNRWRYACRQAEAKRVRLEAEVVRLRAGWDHAAKLAEAGADCQSRMSHENECARWDDLKAICDCGVDEVYQAFDDALAAYDAAVKECKA